MSKIKVKNIASGELIEVPFAHAMEVLLPQKKYELADDEIRAALDNPINQETGESNFDEESIKAKFLRTDLTDILDRAEIKYPPNSNKGELLRLIKQSKLMGVDLGD
jgi:hypothetical protein